MLTWENVISYAPIVNRATINKCTWSISTKEMILECVLMNIRRILSYDIHKIVLSLVYFIYVLYLVRAQGVFVLSKIMQLESKIIHVTTGIS